MDSVTFKSHPCLHEGTSGSQMPNWNLQRRSNVTKMLVVAPPILPPPVEGSEVRKIFKWLKWLPSYKWSAHDKKNWRGLDFFLDLSWKLFSNSQNKTNIQPLDVFVMPESLPLLTQKKELETFSMLIHWFKISNHGIVILQWGSVLGACILTMFAWILLWSTSCKGHKAWTNSLLTENQPKKKQTAGTEKAERVKQLMTVHFCVCVIFLVWQDCRFLHDGQARRSQIKWNGVTWSAIFATFSRLSLPGSVKLLFRHGVLEVRLPFSSGAFPFPTFRQSL